MDLYTRQQGRMIQVDPDEVPNQGQMGASLDTKILKVGDGIRPWRDLPLVQQVCSECGKTRD